MLAASGGEGAATQRAVERIAECFEAEVGALVREGVVVATVGFPRGKVPEAELLEVAEGRRYHLGLPGAGTGTVVVVPVDTAPSSSIVLGRSGHEVFGPEEISLLRGMARVLALALEMLHLIDTERSLREESERQAEDNAGLIASLQQSEERTRAILQAANDAFISMDSEGRITAWNERTVTTFGWSEAEAIGRPLADTIIPARHRQAHQRGLERFLATGEGPVLNRRIEITAVRRDGSEFPVELAIWPVRSDQTWSFNAFVHDISERHLAEEQLRNNERRLADAQEIAMLGSWEWDMANDEVSCTDQLYRIFGVAQGAVLTYRDFISLVHPADREVVEQTFRAALERHQPFEYHHRLVRPGGAERVLHGRGEVVVDSDGLAVKMWGTGQDVTERTNAEKALREANRRLQELASTDPLTGLPNRALFSDRLDQALSFARRENREVSVLFIDLDRFKNVNDSLGHHHGDELLVEVSRRLVGVLRDSDTVARLGGDEFALLLAGSTPPEEAAAVAERILASLRHSFVGGGVELFVSASIGIALWPEDCDSKTELLQHADVAMYRAKAAGGNRFEMFQPGMTVAARERLRVENDLRRAIERDEFFLRYHPIVDLASGKTNSVEALLRWEHPSRGEVMPAEFISLAEDTALIVPIGVWVLSEACRQAALWRKELGDRAPQRVSVNVSALQLAHPGFVAVVKGALADTGTHPSELELEVTESTLIGDSGPAVAALRSLRQLGVSLSIDDFGTGYSSLAYLRRFPVDRLKLDMSFVAGIGGADEPAGNGDALVAAAITLAHALGVEAVAEGVETEDQLHALRSFGCEHGQGFFWTVPLRAGELTRWLATAGKVANRR